VAQAEAPEFKLQYGHKNKNILSLKMHISPLQLLQPLGVLFSMLLPCWLQEHK
jgi:hypothetical protein